MKITNSTEGAVVCARQCGNAQTCAPALAVVAVEKHPETLRVSTGQTKRKYILATPLKRAGRSFYFIGAAK